VKPLHWSRQFWRAPLFWLAVLYLVVGVAYALVTPMLEKPDEQGHYGYIRYLRAQRKLPPLHSSDPWLIESKQPPLYYVVTAALTAWLPILKDEGQLLVLNPYMDLSVPGYRNDNRNQYLHPPDLTPLVLGARLVSLALGLGTVLVSYWLARQLFPRRTLVPIAVAAIVGFQPKFIYIATAVNNDAAVVFLSTSVTALLVYRLQKGHLKRFPLLLGALLGLAGLTKVSGLVLLPLVGLALLFIHRGSFGAAFFREGLTILAVALFVGGWWYARNALHYDDPLTIGAHTSEPAEVRPLGERLGHDLSGIEHTFWANPARTFVSEIWLDKVLIWWGRVSLALLVVGLLIRFSDVQANLPTLIVLSSWPLTYLFLLLFYWNREFRWPFGRLLFPALAPLFLLLVWGWQWAFPRRWRRPLTALGAGSLVLASALIPYVSLYPLYRPWHGRSAEQVEHPVNTVYVEAEGGKEIARLIGYNLPEPFAAPGTYYPIELCWESLGQTDEPYAVFVQLLDLSQLDAFDAPGIWGRRETYPGLGNLPTSRWALHETFCSTLMTWVYPEAPTPLGAAIEVGFVDPQTAKRLQPVDAQGEPASLTYVGGVPILSPPLRTSETPPLYVLDGAIGLNQVQFGSALTLTWQALSPVPYDATMFVHLRGEDGDALAQVDRQPLNGRFPTSYWLPGQVITDVVHLSVPETYSGALTLNIGLYTWPSLVRLPVVDASGTPQRDDMIVVTRP
jgi:4-amino-4-deoxy-L-arabinose transferase-like glycosyltransferase